MALLNWYRPTNNDLTPQSSLQSTISTLENQLISLQSQLQEVTSKLRSLPLPPHPTENTYWSPTNRNDRCPNTTPSQTVQNHIRLLHDYNEIRDIGQGLLGLIAEKRGVRYKDVLEEFGVDHDDWSTTLFEEWVGVPEAWNPNLPLIMCVWVHEILDFDEQRLFYLLLSIMHEKRRRYHRQE